MAFVTSYEHNVIDRLETVQDCAGKAPIDLEVIWTANRPEQDEVFLLDQQRNAFTHLLHVEGYRPAGRMQWKPFGHLVELVDAVAPDQECLRQARAARIASGWAPITRHEAIIHPTDLVLQADDREVARELLKQGTKSAMWLRGNECWRDAMCRLLVRRSWDLPEATSRGDLRMLRDSQAALS